MRIWLSVMMIMALSSGARPDEDAGAIASTQEQIMMPARVLLPGQEPVTIEALIIESAPPVFHLKGNVEIAQGRKRFLSEEATYNSKNNTGVLKRATFTTCEKEHPDYRITAEEIRLTSGQRLKIRRPRIYLGSICLISLPSLSLKTGAGAGQQALFPSPGLDSNDGFSLTTSYPIMDTDRSYTDLRVRLTTKQGIQGGLAGGYAIGGSTRLISPFVPDFDMELRRSMVLRPIVEEYPTGKPDPPLLAAFVGLLSRERLYDINNRSLHVSRLPEVGIRYVSPRICVLDQDEGLTRLSPQFQGRASWGRFKEMPDGSSIGRWDVRGTVTTTLAVLGRGTSLRGVGMARYSSYNSGNSYRTLGAALDASHVFSGGSFASVRFIVHNIHGLTPFEFDDIDIPRELQVSGRYIRGKNKYDILLDYDVNEGLIRDWQLSFTRTMHCLEPTITWRNRFKQINLSIGVLGL